MVPESGRSKSSMSLFREASLPLGSALSVPNGIIITLIGIIVLLGILGFVPLTFNSSGQLGLLLVLTSLQMLALGQLIVPLTRSWLLIAIGIVFAGMGIISCIVPGVLVAWITILLGVQNLISGGLVLASQLKGLSVATLTLGIAIVLFGVNTLSPVLLPSLFGVIWFLVLPVLLLFMGLSSLYSTYLSTKPQ
jgi:hypothetical protein